MRKLNLLSLTIILVSTFFLKNVSAQNVGINATGAAPNASAILDVSSTDKGFLIPRVALTQTNSNAPIGASIVTSLLVYNTATLNDVTPGFYYWDGLIWIRFQSNLDIDHDWYEVGTTTAPDNINDSMFHLGNTAIGKNTAAYRLDIDAGNALRGVNVVQNSAAPGAKYAQYNTISSTTSDNQYGIFNTINNTGNALQYGIYNILNGNGNSTRTGIYNNISGTSTTGVVHDGIVNEITISGNAVSI